MSVKKAKVTRVPRGEGRLVVNISAQPGAEDKAAQELIKKAAKAAFSLFGYGFCARVDVLLTGDKEIREINNRHRKIDKATDVLSFPMQDMYRGKAGSLPQADPDTGLVMLGDMVISAQRAREQAKELGHGFDRECAYLTVHSILHLLGFDHTDEGQEKAAMRKMEEAALSKIGLQRG